MLELRCLTSHHLHLFLILEAEVELDIGHGLVDMAGRLIRIVEGLFLVEDSNGAFHLGEQLWQLCYFKASKGSLEIIITEGTGDVHCLPRRNESVANLKQLLFVVDGGNLSAECFGVIGAVVEQNLTCLSHLVDKSVGVFDNLCEIFDAVVNAGLVRVVEAIQFAQIGGVCLVEVLLDIRKVDDIAVSQRLIRAVNPRERL